MKKIFVFISIFISGLQMLGQVDTVWQVSDAKEKLILDLPVDFSIYKYDSITGFFHFEKWEYETFVESCDFELIPPSGSYYKREEGLLTERNPDIKEGAWMRYNSMGMKNIEIFNDNKLIKISEQTTISINGKMDTLEIPIYEITQLDYPDSTYKKTITQVQTYYESIPIDNQACFQGKIFISFIIGLDGTTSEIEILKGVHKTFDSMAIKAVKENEFDYCKVNGKSVLTKVIIPIKIKLI